jgi:hypothetical protein
VFEGYLGTQVMVLLSLYLRCTFELKFSSSFSSLFTSSAISMQYNKSCFQQMFCEIVKIIRFMNRKGELRGIHQLRNYVHAGKDCHSRFFANKYSSTCFWMYDFD